MMSAHTRLLVLCGFLIAALAASVSALVMSHDRPAATSAQQTHLLTTALAASTTGNTITVVGVGNGTGTPNSAQLQFAVSATRPNVHDAVSAAGHRLSIGAAGLRVSSL